MHGELRGWAQTGLVLQEASPCPGGTSPGAKQGPLHLSRDAVGGRSSLTLTMTFPLSCLVRHWVLQGQREVSTADPNLGRAFGHGYNLRDPVQKHMSYSQLGLEPGSCPSASKLEVNTLVLHKRGLYPPKKLARLCTDPSVCIGHPGPGRWHSASPFAGCRRHASGTREEGESSRGRRGFSSPSRRDGEEGHLAARLPVPG